MVIRHQENTSQSGASLSERIETSFGTNQHGFFGNKEELFSVKNKRWFLSVYWSEQLVSCVPVQKHVDQQLVISTIRVAKPASKKDIHRTTQVDHLVARELLQFGSEI